MPTTHAQPARAAMNQASRLDTPPNAPRGLKRQIHRFLSACSADLLPSQCTRPAPSSAECVPLSDEGKGCNGPESVFVGQNQRFDYWAGADLNRRHTDFQSVCHAHKPSNRNELQSGPAGTTAPLHKGPRRCCQGHPQGRAPETWRTGTGRTASIQHDRAQCYPFPQPPPLQIPTHGSRQEPGIRPMKHTPRHRR